MTKRRFTHAWLRMVLFVALAAPAPAGAETAPSCAGVIEDTEMLAILLADRVPFRFSVVFDDPRTGAERGLTYLRSEIVDGERVFVFRGRTLFDELRLTANDVLAEGKPGTFKIRRPGSEPRAREGSGAGRHEATVETKPDQTSKEDPKVRSTDGTAVRTLGDKAKARRAGGKKIQQDDEEALRAKRKAEQDEDDKPVSLKERTVTISGHEGKYPETDYIPVRRDGETATIRGEKVLSDQRGTPVKLDKPLGVGGTRRVYEDPADGAWVFKIYDRTVARVGETLTTGKIASLIQMELAMEDYLVRMGFRIARIDRSPAAQALWKYGIIRQQNINQLAKGKLRQYFDVVPENYLPGSLPHVDTFHDKLKQFDHAFIKANGDVNGLGRVLVQGSSETLVGIDVGVNYSNVLFDDLGAILLDW